MIRFSLLVLCLAAAPLFGQAPKTAPELEKSLELFRATKFDDALEELRKVTKANPNLAPPRVILAEWFAAANRPGEARANIERAAIEDPKNPEVYLRNASFAFAEQRVSDAILNLQFVQQLAPDVRWTADQRKRFLLESRLGLASCYETRGDAAGVKEVLQAVLNDDPKNGTVRQRFAAAVFSLGKPEEAFTELSKAFTDDPAVEMPELRMAALWSAKANAAAKMEEAKAPREQAEAWLQKAIKEHSRSARPYRSYANWLLEEGRPEAATPYVDAAVKLEPTKRETLMLQGVHARYKKEFASAESAFEALYKDGPNDAFAVGNLAIVLAESGKEEKQKRAINLAKAFVLQNPRLPDALAIQGWCEFKMGRLEDAERDLRAAANLGSLGLDSIYFFAKVLADLKKPEDAYKFLKLALDSRGPFVYRPDAASLFAELHKSLPKQDPTKK